MLALLAIICAGGVNAAVGDTYKLVTSVDELKAGDVIVIGCKQYAKAMGAQNKNNRAAVDITITNGVFSFVDGIEELTLKKVNEKWQLVTSDGKYLYQPAKNKLQSTDDASNTNTQASISFTSAGNSTICFGEFTSFIKLNKAPYCFSCYASSTSNTYTVQIYKKQVSGKTTTTTFGADYDNKAFTFVGGEPKDFRAPTARCTTEGVTGTIAYSSSDTEIVTVDAKGALTFTNTKFGTATITATFTPNDKDKYAQSTATYTVTNTPLYNGIAEFKKAITGESEKDALEATLNLTDAVVTYVNGKNTYIQDATAGILIYGVDGFAVGDKFTGKVTVKAYKYSGLNEIVSWAAAADMVKATGADIPVKEVTLAELQDDTYESMRVKVVGVTATKAFASRKATLKQGDVTIELYDKVNGLNITANSVYDIIGYPGINKTIRQLTVWSQDNIMAHQEADKADPEIAFKETEKTVELKEVSMKLSTLINNPHSLPVTYTSSDAEVAEVSEGVIYMNKTGKVDITATFAGNDKYNATEKTLALTIVDNRADAGIHFEKDSYTADINKDEFKGAVLVNPNKLAVTYSISPDDETALIEPETGFVTYTKGTEASYEVTAKFSGNEIYKPATVTYTLNVEDPNYEVKTVTFVAGTDKGSLTIGATIGTDKISKLGVTISSDKARLNTEEDKGYRFYKDGSITVAADMGEVTNVIFTSLSTTNTPENLTADGYNNTTYTWEGKQKSVVFSAGAKVFLSKIIVTVKVPVAKDFTLDEDKDNVVEAAENANVTLKRTLYADGGWNTLCLPFSLTDEQTKVAFGDDVELRTLASFDGKTLTFAKAAGITAGVPCLIKVSKVAENNTYTFTGVSVKAIKADNDKYDMDETLTFVGIYAPMDVATAFEKDGNALFLGAGNKFYKAKAGTMMKAFRAFFLVPASTDTQALRAVIDGTTTGIDDLNIDTVKADGRVYNLNGQCVGYSLEGLKAGIYIQNGKKVIKK